MKHLYFVRHGESQLNAQHIFAGQTDTPLTDKGRQQAQAAGQQAVGLPIDLIVASPLIRALETAQIIAAAINYAPDSILINDVFKERSLGSLEGKSWDEYDESVDNANDAETDEQLLARAHQGLVFLKTLSADTVLLTGHGSYSRALRTAIDPNQTYEEPGNAEIIRLL